MSNYDSTQESLIFTFQKIAPMEFGLAYSANDFLDDLSSLLTQAHKQTEDSEGDDWKGLIYCSPEKDSDFTFQLEVEVWASDNAPSYYQGSLDVEYAEVGFRYVSIVELSNFGSFNKFEALIDSSDFPDYVIDEMESDIYDSLDNLAQSFMARYGDDPLY